MAVRFSSKNKKVVKEKKKRKKRKKEEGEKEKEEKEHKTRIKRKEGKTNRSHPRFARPIGADEAAIATDKAHQNCHHLLAA